MCYVLKVNSLFLDSINFRLHEHSQPEILKNSFVRVTDEGLLQLDELEEGSGHIPKVLTVGDNGDLEFAPLESGSGSGSGPVGAAPRKKRAANVSPKQKWTKKFWTKDQKGKLDVGNVDCLKVLFHSFFP